MKDEVFKYVFLGLSFAVLLGLAGLAYALVYWIFRLLKKKIVGECDSEAVKMKPTFGVVSIVCFLTFIAGLVAWFYALMLLVVGAIAQSKSPSDTPFPTAFWLPAVLCPFFSMISSILGIASGFKSIRRKEYPKCIRYIGLSLNLLPISLFTLSLVLAVVLMLTNTTGLTSS